MRYPLESLKTRQDYEAAYHYYNALSIEADDEFYNKFQILPNKATDEIKQSYEYQKLVEINEKIKIISNKLFND